MDIGRPVLETRQVLLNHLSAKVWPICQSKIFAKDISLEIAEQLSDKDIIHLLENEVALKEAVCLALSTKEQNDNKQALGEKLFITVATLESELCAQITGMLLELDETTIETLLSKEDSLRAAVHKAKQKYLQYTQAQSSGRSIHEGKHEDVGEILYELVSHHHPNPDLAARLTGMLLELESHHLTSLMQHPEELKLKLEVACQALANQK